MIDRRWKNAAVISDLLATAEWTHVSRVNSQLSCTLVLHYVLFKLRVYTDKRISVADIPVNIHEQKRNFELLSPVSTTRVDGPS